MLAESGTFSQWFVNIFEKLVSVIILNRINIYAQNALNGRMEEKKRVNKREIMLIANVRESKDGEYPEKDSEQKEEVPAWD